MLWNCETLPFLGPPTHTTIQSAWCLHTKPQLLVRSQASCHQWFSMVFLGRAYFGKPRASWKLRDKVKSVASWTLLPHLTTPTTPLKVKRVASRCIKSVTFHEYYYCPAPLHPPKRPKREETWINHNKPTWPSKNGAHGTYMWFSHIWVIAFISYLWKATKNQRRLMGPSYIIYTYTFLQWCWRCFPRLSRYHLFG